MEISVLSPHPFFLLVIILLLSSIAPTRQDIPLASSLSTDVENSSWVSPSGEFAFGFIHFPNEDLFLLAIWLEKIPNKTVVWSANGGNLVRRGSKVELTTDGRLVLFDHLGSEKWKPKATRGSATSAAMRDDGNFVLRSIDSSPIWGSFEEPTDTLLPTQILGKQSKLSSRQTESDYSKGKFQLRLQDDGNLRLYTVALPDGEIVYGSYWEPGTVGSGSQVVFDKSGHLYLNQTDGKNFPLTLGKVVSSQYFYHRVTLDFDGVLRQYVHPRSLQTSWAQSWSVVWYSPENICVSVTSAVGSGTCGFNSFCRLNEEQRPSCECPPEYSFIDQNNHFKGCKKNFLPQSCESDGGSGVAPKFELREMSNVDWPLNDYEDYYEFDEDQCRRSCMADCFCDVAIFIRGSCWKKKMPVSNGRMDDSVKRKTLIKVPISNSSEQTPPTSNNCREKKDQTTLILIGSVLFGGSGLLNILLLSTISLVLLYSYRRQRKLMIHRSNASMLGKRIHFFTYKELEQATDGFKEELGRGGFGTVYKGVLALDSRHPVAVKKLDKLLVMREAEREFKAEVTAIGQTHHKNLARLLGFCNEGQHRLLVFEFMSNGSLASSLFGSMKPDWNQRVQISLGVAKGLAYLHEECSTQIIHCDINPRNILLDDFFTARISDFGLAKLIMKADQTRSITTIRGTKGYVAPEWFRSTPVTAKVDVYSFGVVLLEIICCRPNVELRMEDEERAILTDWAYDCYAQRKLGLLVENDEEAMNDMKRVERMVMVAIWCIQEYPTMRPCMEKVAEMLEGAVEVYPPPCPYSVSSFA